MYPLLRAIGWSALAIVLITEIVEDWREVQDPPAVCACEDGDRPGR